MSSSYESAKRVALGLEAAQKARVGEDLWSVSLGSGISLQAELPFQYFGKEFEPPEEQEAQKVTLMVYKREYAADRKKARNLMKKLVKLLISEDVTELRRMLTADPPAEWLSLTFLDGDSVRDELVPALEKTGPDCRRVFSDSLDLLLEQLVNFKGLAEKLKEYC